jgi:glycerol-3-phosphate acyltransferase PlsX
VEGALAAHREGVPVVLVGDPAILSPMLPAGCGLAVVPASQAVGMDEAPASAIRRKPDASIRVAIDQVKSGLACAAVSFGNTGAAVAAATLDLGRMPGVKRPAVTTCMPRLDGGQLVVLDLGAGVDAKPEHLLQFAEMGAAYAACMMEIEGPPRVGLLSNGEEESKGNALVRAANVTLAEAPDVNFVGNVEPIAAFRGACDVLVCDGFVGNVMLKSLEAAVEVVGHVLKEEVTRHPTAMLGAWLLQGVRKRLAKRTEHAAIGGALLLGVDGLVVVGHGRAGPRAVKSALKEAHRLSGLDICARVTEALQAGAPQA